MRYKGFWTPMMAIIGLMVIVMLLIIFQTANIFTTVDWNTVNPQIIQFAPYIILITVAFSVFLYLRGK